MNQFIPNMVQGLEVYYFSPEGDEENPVVASDPVIAWAVDPDLDGNLLPVTISAGECYAEVVNPEYMTNVAGCFTDPQEGLKACLEKVKERKKDA